MWNTLYLGKKTLSKKFLCTTTRLDVQEGIVSFADVAVTEGTQTKLNHGTIVQNLGWQIWVVDGFLKEICRVKWLQ